MTKVLTTDADHCFSSGISSDIWKEIGVKLGFSAAAIAATTTVAASGSTAAASSGAATATLASGVATTGATTAAVAGGTNLLSVMMAVGAGVAAIAAATIILQPIPDTPHAPIAQASTSSVVELLEEPSSAEQEPAPTAPKKPSILIEHDMLHYPAGQAPSTAQILLDSGAKGLDENGGAVDLEVLEYERIDFHEPDEYFVYLALAKDEGIRRVVIISVE